MYIVMVVATCAPRAERSRPHAASTTKVQLGAPLPSPRLLPREPQQNNFTLSNSFYSFKGAQRKARSALRGAVRAWAELEGLLRTRARCLARQVRGSTECNISLPWPCHLLVNCTYHDRCTPVSSVALLAGSRHMLM